MPSSCAGGDRSWFGAGIRLRPTGSDQLLRRLKRVRRCGVPSSGWHTGLQGADVPCPQQGQDTAGCLCCSRVNVGGCCPAFSSLPAGSAEQEEGSSLLVQAAWQERQGLQKHHPSVSFKHSRREQKHHCHSATCVPAWPASREPAQGCWEKQEKEKEVRARSILVGSGGAA